MIILRCEVTKGMSENIEKWIGVDEAAEHLGVKASTLRAWVNKNKGIPAHRIGKFWKFKLSELEEWVTSGKSAGL